MPKRQKVEGYTVMIALATWLLLQAVEVVGENALGTEHPKRSAPVWAKPGRVSSRPIGCGMWGFHNTVVLHPTNPDIAFTAADMGASLARTTDGGKSWKHAGNSGVGQQIPASVNFWIIFNPKDPNIVWTGDALGVYRSTDGGETWKNLIENPHELPTSFGRCHFILDPSHPNTLYALRVGQENSALLQRPDVLCYRSANGGRAWKLRSDSKSRKGFKSLVKNAAIDPTSRSRLYVWDQGGVMCSEDMGKNWKWANGNLPGGHVVGGQLTVVNGKAVLFTCLETHGVYRSDDGGETWQTRNKGLDWVRKSKKGGDGQDSRLRVSDKKAGAIQFCSTDPRIGYVAVNGRGVYKTEDGGESWFASLVARPRYANANDGSGSEARQLVPAKGGSRRSPRAESPGCCSAIAISQSNPKIVMMSTSVVLRSEDGGQTWWDAAVELGDRFQPADRFTEFDMPTRFTHRIRARGNFDQVAWDMAADPFDPDTLAIAYQEMGLQISRDGGAWWEWSSWGIDDKATQDDGACVVYDPDVPGRVYYGLWGKSAFFRNLRSQKFVEQHYIFLSEDGGRNFRGLTLPGFSKLRELPVEQWGNLPSVFDIAIDTQSPPKARRLYAATTFGLFRSEDGGKNWQDCDFGLNHALDVSRVAVELSNHKIVYAGVLGDSGTKWGEQVKQRRGLAYPRGLYRSTNGGKRFHQIAKDKIGGVIGISVCKKNPAVLYITALPTGKPARTWGLSHELWKSDDRGENWRRIDMRNLILTRAAVSPDDPDRVYVTTHDGRRGGLIGLFRSRDSGKTWTQLDAGLFLSPRFMGFGIRFDPVDPRRLFVFDNVSAWEVWDREAPIRRSH